MRYAAEGDGLKAILVVDDDPDIRLFCKDRLEAWGYAVHTAVSGEQALALVPTLAIQAVLLDLHLPDIEGAEVLRAMRARGLECPILLLSAAHSSKLTPLVGPSGAQGFLSKPFDSLGLQHWIMEWVGAA